MKKKKIGWIIACLVGFAATPWAFRQAFLVRGYEAIGGEVLVPFIVPMAWFVWEQLREMFAEIFEEEKR